PRAAHPANSGAPPKPISRCLHAWPTGGGGRPSASTDPVNATETVTRDPNGNPTVIVDRKGQRTEITRGVGDRVTQVVYKRADGTVESTVTYTYSGSTDLLTSISDTAGPGYSFTYNSLDQPATLTGPEGVTTLGYDTYDRLASAQAPGQAAVQYAYDAYGRLASVQQGSQA